MHRKRFSEPLEELELDDEDDLSALALALEEVATLLAAHPLLVSLDLADIDSEPLESLIARAAAAVRQQAKAAKWVQYVAELAELAHGSRYDTGPNPSLARARMLRGRVVKALAQLEKVMG
jgi:hypothetical protein